MKAIEQIITEAKKKVRVRCDEYHAHSAKADCLAGPQDAIDICILAEEIAELKGKLDTISELAKTLDEIKPSP